MKGLKLIIAGLVLPTVALGGTYAGNGSVKTIVVGRTNWTLDTTGLDETTATLTACTGGSTTTVEASSESNGAISFAVPAGSWCSASMAYASHVYVDNYGPAARELHLDMALNTVSVPFAGSLDVSTGQTAPVIVEMGSGGFLEFAEGFLNEGQVKYIDSTITGYNTIRNELRDVRWYLDADGSGALSSSERENGLIGASN